MREIYKFGPFELDSQRAELRKAGFRVRLQEQPFRILVLLLEARGSVVTRQEMQRALWPEDTYVEFEHGLNAAVNKLRETLGDSASSPRFVETVPRRGYRFIAAVEIQQDQPPAPPGVQPGRRRRTGVSRAAMLGAGLAVVMAAMALQGVAVFARRGQPGAGDPVPRPLTTYRGIELSPSFSPDGERVAFTWGGGDKRDFDIHVKQIGNEQPMRLTTDSADDVQPVWSPDGRTIAFLRANEEGKADIILIPAVGGPEHKVADLHTDLSSARYARLMTWLSDSRHVVVADKVTANAPRALFRLSVVTGERQQITFPPASSAGDEGADLSPDGRTLVFARETNPMTSELFLLPMSRNFSPSGEPRQLTKLNVASSEPLWTPDGSELIFISGPQHARRFFRLRADGSEAPVPILPVTENCRGGVAISRTKNRLAFSRSNWDVNIWKADSYPAARRLTPFIRSTYLDHLPAFSPDGSRVAFVSNRTGKLQLWMSRSDGSESEILVATDGEVDFHSWSPDGKLLAFGSQVEGFNQIFTVSADGGSPKQVTTGSHTNNSSPTWSHDGKALYFTSDRDGGRQIWRMSMKADGGLKPVRITREGGERGFESCDGKYLFYVRNHLHGLLYKRSLADGKEQVIAGPLINAGSFVLSKTGVYFIAVRRQDGTAPIQFLRFGSSRPSTIARTDNLVAWGVSVSPDESSLLFAQYDRVDQDLMLVDDFR